MVVYCSNPVAELWLYKSLNENLRQYFSELESYSKNELETIYKQKCLGNSKFDNFQTELLFAV